MTAFQYNPGDMRRVEYLVKLLGSRHDLPVESNDQYMRQCLSIGLRDLMQYMIELSRIQALAPTNVLDTVDTELNDPDLTVYEDLIRIQGAVLNWYRNKRWRSASPVTQMLGLVEEVGEVAKLINLYDGGYQGDGDDPTDDNQIELMLETEIRHVFLYLVALITSCGLSLAEIITPQIMQDLTDGSDPSVPDEPPDPDDGSRWSDDDQEAAILHLTLEIQKHGHLMPDGTVPFNEFDLEGE